MDQFSLIFSILNPIVTLVAGIVAYVVYQTDKADKKRNAAQAILAEVQNAEVALDQLRSGGAMTVGPLATVLRTDYWSQYGNLLLDEFDFIEQRTIAQFYNACKVAQKKVESIQEERSEQHREGGFELQRQIVRLCLDAPDDATYQARRTQMVERYHKEGYWFAQNATKEVLTNAFVLTPSLSNTPVGEKLRRIAGIS